MISWCQSVEWANAKSMSNLIRSLAHCVMGRHDYCSHLFTHDAPWGMIVVCICVCDIAPRTMWGCGVRGRVCISVCDIAPWTMWGRGVRAGSMIPVTPPAYFTPDGFGFILGLRNSHSSPHVPIHRYAWALLCFSGPTTWSYYVLLRHSRYLSMFGGQPSLIVCAIVCVYN